MEADVDSTVGLNGAHTENRAGVARDLEMTRLCAEAMGLREHASLIGTGDRWAESYDPLHDDAQCMALLKRFRECVYAVMDLDNSRSLDEAIEPEAYNRAIVECVAKMQATTHPQAPARTPP